MLFRTDCPKLLGMAEFTSFKSIIDLWPSREAMADDVSASAGMKLSGWTVSKWRQRNSIPAEWWSAVLGTDLAARSGLSAETMTALVARPIPADPIEARA